MNALDKNGHPFLKVILTLYICKPLTRKAVAYASRSLMRHFKKSLCVVWTLSRLYNEGLCFALYL